MLVCALVSQSVKCETLCFSIIHGKLLDAIPSFEIKEGETPYSKSQFLVYWKTFSTKKEWVKQTESEV